MQVYKYDLEITDQQIIEMPVDANLLTVQLQNGNLKLWAAVDSNIMTKRSIIILGTGHKINYIPKKYIGTFQMMNGKLVFHVFDDGEV
jgi:putative transposon-encoded protein